jgi:lysophospholipid acyltransferase (LPLAT)-like uncharacterized protein
VSGGLRDSVVPMVAAGVVRALGATVRFVVEGVDGVAPLWTARRPVIYAVWHGRILLAPWANERMRRSHGARRTTALASRSRDGELVARFVARFGLGIARGSSSRGGAMALRALASALAAGDDAVIVPDGPRGPARRVQPGVVALAALTGAPVVPFGMAARPAITLGSWDRFQVPVPFARVAVCFGPPMPIARGGDYDAAGRALATALDAATETADRLAAGGRPTTRAAARAPEGTGARRA